MGCPPVTVRVLPLYPWYPGEHMVSMDWPFVFRRSFRLGLGEQQRATPFACIVDGKK